MRALATLATGHQAMTISRPGALIDAGAAAVAALSTGPLSTLVGALGIAVALAAWSAEAGAVLMLDRR